MHSSQHKVSYALTDIRRFTVTTQDAGRHVSGTFYRIRIGEHLDPECSAWLAGMTITNLDQGEALLSGVLIDQAALYGVLQTLRDMNITLLDIRSGDQDQSRPLSCA